MAYNLKNRQNDIFCTYRITISQNYDAIEQLWWQIWIERPNYVKNDFLSFFQRAEKMLFFVDLCNSGQSWANIDLNMIYQTFIKNTLFGLHQIRLSCLVFIILTILFPSISLFILSTTPFICLFVPWLCRKSNWCPGISLIFSSITFILLINFLDIIDSMLIGLYEVISVAQF